MTNNDSKFGSADPKEQWAEQFNIRKASVPGQPNTYGGYWRQTNFIDPDSPEHLF
jgi:hypothetical protein